MGKRVERLLILLIDFFTINLAAIVFYFFKVESGIFEMLIQPDMLLYLFSIYLYWLLIFIFVGMYRTWFASSRLDELSTLFKTTFIGIFILFFLILYDDFVHGVESSSRFVIFIYWLILFFCVGFGRLFVRGIQRKFLLRGVGRRCALIIGFNPKANKIHDSIHKYRALGIDIEAYIAVNKENVGKEYNGVTVVNTVNNLKEVIQNFKAKDIVIALEKYEDNVMLEVIDKCDGMNVNLKIVPDLHEIISGQAKTSQIYGFPLIDIMPELMPEWEKKIKVIMDYFVAIIITVLTLPITLATAIIIKMESKGPIFYKQERMGLNGKLFEVYKFRSMVQDAEVKSGPVWSTKGDPRITKVGEFIRKVRIDEIPQMINVLKGDMSLVGPRPEREYFVNELSKEIPLYRRRLKVRPGVTGWAQVKHKYDETFEDVKTKLKYDLFYIENMSLRMDIKILFRTIFVVLFGKGHYE